mmetsp:Transcript_24427/g.57298  ORF Transcript_24427/g.57298 Transcript_24427/m.57298 type:complete len:530 (+) Transcript_24427:13-1602(+)
MTADSANFIEEIAQPYPSRMDLATNAAARTSLGSLHHVLKVGRAGAAMAAAQTAVEMSGGAILKEESAVEETLLGLQLTPEGKAVVFMAIAMACHYLGYSFARPVTVALFTSASTGYAGFAPAFPLAMAFVSPFSLLLLMLYGNILDTVGPAGALLQTTGWCAVVVMLSAFAIAVLTQTKATLFGKIPAVKLISGPLFIFRESYVQLLTSQYWSFMASALTPSQSGRWFGPIAGLTSIASVIAGLLVSPIVDRLGLEGALMGTGIMLLVSLVWARKAFQIADKHGFTPSDHKKHGDKKTSLFALFEKAGVLFKRVPVLGALFVEILASQGLATLLNVCFVARLGSAIPDDTKRAGWVGLFFALINVITMVLQFGILPFVMKVVEPRDAWRVIPLFSLASVGFQAFQKDPSLFIVSASLLVMKVSEYSARRMLDEMVFVPLDFESRYVGKEVIGVFGYRFGKSLMSLALSGLTSVMGNFGLHQLSILSSLVACGWMQTAWNLSKYVPTRREAEEQYLAKSGDKKSSRKRQ